MLEVSGWQQRRLRFMFRVLFAAASTRAQKRKCKGRAKKGSRSWVANCLGIPTAKEFSEHGTFGAKSRKVLGKLGRVGCPVWKVVVCASLELEATKQTFCFCCWGSEPGGREVRKDNLEENKVTMTLSEHLSIQLPSAYKVTTAALYNLTLSLTEM